MKLAWNGSKNKVRFRNNRFIIIMCIRILRVLTLRCLLKDHSRRNNSGNTNLNVSLLYARGEDFYYLSSFSLNHSFCQE